MKPLLHAPKLNASNLPWFNTRAPLDLSDFKGKLAILDFWTYCCINCIHVIPTLKRIEESFPDSVVVVGIHSPKFPGEKNTRNLEQAIHRYEIEHPVVQDVDFSIWKNYAIRAWPTLILVGPNRYILGEYPGEPNPDMLLNTIDGILKGLRSQNALFGNAKDLLFVDKSADAKTLSFPGKISYSLEDKEFAIADSNHNQIVTADSEGRITRRIGSGKAGKSEGTFNEAEFFRPQGLCFQEGQIWVADTENHLLRRIDVKGETVTTCAGTGKQGAALKRGREVSLSSPWDVSIADGWLYFANAGSHQIGVYHIDEGTIEPFAGTSQEALIDGPRFNGAFAQPSGLSTGDNKLFLADSETSAIRSVRLDEFGFIATYVGRGLFDFGDHDGKGKLALLQHPLGVHYSRDKVYIADSYNHKIKVLDLKTQNVTTISFDLEANSIGQLWEPAGVLELNNRLYVSDTNNHRVLKIDLESRKAEVFID